MKKLLLLIGLVVLVNGCGSTYSISEEELAEIRAKREIAKEEEKRKEEEEMIAQISIQKALCSEMGFKNENDGMHNCVLKLMTKQAKEKSKKKNRSTVSSYDINKLEKKIKRLESQPNFTWHCAMGIYPCDGLYH